MTAATGTIGPPWDGPGWANPGWDGPGWASPAWDGPARAVAVGRPRLTWALRPDGRPASYAEHTAVFGRLPTVGPQLIDLAEDAGLTGRGGGGFPTGTKLRVTAQAGQVEPRVVGQAGRRMSRSRRRGRPLIVANGAESEPASAKDRLLLTAVPHLVIDGALLAADAVGADRVVLRVHDDPVIVDRLRGAVAERPQHPPSGCRLTVAVTERRYLAGESSALVNELGGGPALPRFALEPAARRGVDGLPTAVLNVESLAALALLARYGAGWFREVGTSDEPGTMLTTVTGAWAPPVVVEAPLGTPLTSVLAAAGVGGAAVSYVLTGGYGGRWLPASALPGVPLSRAGLAGVGGSLGAGVLAVLPPEACGLVEVAPVVRYLAEESAGQCGPCLNGLPAMAAAVGALAEGSADAMVVERLQRWCRLVVGRGACHHPDGVAALVASTLDRFADEVRRHVEHGWCGVRFQEVLPLGPAPDHRGRRR